MGGEAAAHFRGDVLAPLRPVVLANSNIHGFNSQACFSSDRYAENFRAVSTLCIYKASEFIYRERAVKEEVAFL